MFFRLFSVATKKAEVLKYSYGSLIKKTGGAGGGKQKKKEITLWGWLCLLCKVMEP